MNVLGVSAFYHDSAAALVQDGTVVAAAQEERFSRRKHDERFPVEAVAYCLDAGGVEPDGIDAVAYFEKPLTKFVRILRTLARVGPRGFRSYQRAMPVWLRQKLWVSYEIERRLGSLGYRRPTRMLFCEHHQSHAASAFFPSPFESAAVITVDGVGEWATASIGVGRGNRVDLLRQLEFPDSLGLLYSAFTYYCGFRVNSGEYKLMGLAPYGEPSFVDDIYEHLLDLHPDGSFTLDQRYFAYLAGDRMISRRFEELFGGPPRRPESDLTPRVCDLAASIQVVTEEVMLRMAGHAAALTGERRVCLAGGVALNCVANGRLLREGLFEDLWVQPAAGDAGGAVGAALHAWHEVLDQPRHVDGTRDAMAGSYLGPAIDSRSVGVWLTEQGHSHVTVAPADRARRIAELLAEGKVVGVVQGRMEFGPRALGHRSILADPRRPEMQSLLNLAVKRRESFRPFAPCVLAERAGEWFDLDRASPYMLLTTSVAAAHRRDPGPTPDDLRDWAHQVRSDIPAVTHVDSSARVQTVDADESPLLHAVLVEWERLTGCAVLVNTSFNVRGEPIVCSAQDAHRCFMATDIDALVLEDHVLVKTDRSASTVDVSELEMVLD